MTASRTSEIAIKQAGRELKTTWYAEQVIAGKIVTSKKVRLACERHMRDLERSRKDPTFRWVFDPERAYRFIKFCEGYCRPSQGAMDRIQMQPWDHFVWGSIFGWVHKTTGVRRFRYALIFVARKQGKSLKVSCASLFGASKDGERGAKIYLLANTMKQVREAIFDECKRMVNASPSLTKRFKVTRDLVSYHDSEIKPQASDSTKLDSLNTHIGAFDEIHEYKTYKLINVIDNSTGARAQPLILYITTAGYVLDGPLMDMYEQATDVLEGVVDSERFFYFIAELDEEDDIEDTSTWIKANPNLGVSVQLEDLIEKWEKDKHVPAQRNDFITKRLNIFVCADEQSFVHLEALRRNEHVIDLNTLKGQPCIGGYDLSDTEDFTSACLEFPLAPTEQLPDGGVYVLSHSWVPAEKVKRDNEKIDYLGWEKAGHLTICRGEFVDYHDVLEWLIEQSKLYSILRIGYDPRNAFRLNDELKAYGGEEWLEVVRQGHFTLSPAIKDVKTMLLAGRVVSNKDPLLRWYTNNVKLVKDRNGNWLPSKQGRYRKIDGFTAWMNAHVELMKLPAPPPPDSTPVTFISRKDLTR